jgi:hypothetical protein
MRTAADGLLWSPRAVLRWGTAVGVGTVGLVGSWYAVSGRATWAEQVAPMNVGLVAVLVVFAAGASLLMDGRRTIGVRRIALLGEPAPLPSWAAQAAAPTHGLTGFVAGPGLRHYHRADCTLAAGKPFSSASREVHEAAGHTRCGVCQP